MKKIYPSSFASPVGNTTDASYNSGCLRYFKFKDYLPKGVEPDFPELNRAIGTIGEQRVWALLEQWYPDVELSVEESFKQEITDGVMVSGRADFVVRGVNIVGEVKTTRSSARRSQIITKGILPKEYLGQLLTYMVNWDITEGFILVQYVHFPRDLKTLGFVDRKFNVRIAGESIYIDDVLYDSTVSAELRYYDLATDALLEDKVPPKPLTDKPCYYCPFNQLCNDINPPTTPNEFIKRAGTIERDYSKTQKPPRINVHNIKKT